MIRLAAAAGLIRLQVPGKTDVFLSEQVKLDEYQYSWMMGNPIQEPSMFFPGIKGFFPVEGLIQPQPLIVDMSPENTLITGYYEDRYDGYAYQYKNYEITIYVIYDEEEEGDLELKENNMPPPLRNVIVSSCQFKKGEQR